jgi:hypothetical protein
MPLQPARRDHDRVLAHLAESARWRWPQLPPPRTLPWSELTFLALDRGVPWVCGPIERDPAARDGRTVVPGRQLRQLKRFADLGVPFQRLAIAHELDPDGPVAGLLHELQDGPRTCTDEVARTLVGATPARAGVRRALRVLDAALGCGSAAGRAAARTAGRLLDPIVFGVLGAPDVSHGAPCHWFPLAAWRW